MHIDYQIIDAVEASIYWKDLYGKYLGCNKYMAKMAGVSRDQIIGNTDYLLPWRSQANKIKEIDQLVIKNAKKYQIEETVEISNKVVKTFCSSKSPLFFEKNVIGIIGVSIDITKDKLMESIIEETEKILDDAKNIKNRFLNNIDHEVNTPLTTILSIAELLKEKWNKFDNKTRYDSINLIAEESCRLSEFISNVFDVSKFRKSEIELSLKNENFADFLMSEVEKFKNKYRKFNVTFEVNPFDDYTIFFDPTLITKVIKNILMNAIKYAPKEKEITISLYKSYLNNLEIPGIQCSVKDQGVGIPEDELKSIFNPFTESSRTASKACGTGLGLSICKEIIQAHHGNLWIENNVLSQGVTVSFTLPTKISSFSEEDYINKSTKSESSNILRRNLAKLYQDSKRKPFALIGISTFNSYFSTEKILEICEWIHREYTTFGIFIPDEISRYTFEALGYDESRINRKIKKQDNYTINKVNAALSHFYEKYPNAKKIKIYNLSLLKDNKHYQHLYNMYSNLFLSDKMFRENCLEVTTWVLLNTVAKKTEGSTKEVKIYESQKAIAVQYFLLELPIMANFTEVQKLESCDFVYHTIPDFLKNLYSTQKLVSPNQRFLILK
jgi:tRNA-dependent cyclodipeptide synthase